MGTLTSLFLRPESFRLSAHSTITRLLLDDPTPWITQPVLFPAETDSVLTPHVLQAREDLVLLTNLKRYLLACYKDVEVLVGLHAKVRVWVLPRLRPFRVEYENRGLGRGEREAMEEVREVARRAGVVLAGVEGWYRGVFVEDWNGVGLSGDGYGGDEEAVLAFTSSFLSLSAELTPAIAESPTRRPEWREIRRLATEHLVLLMDTWASLIYRSQTRERLQRNPETKPLRWRYCPGAVVLQALLRAELQGRRHAPEWMECPTDILHPWMSNLDAQLESEVSQRGLNMGGRVKSVFCVHCGQTVEGWVDPGFSFSFMFFDGDIAQLVDRSKAVWFFAACHVQELGKDGEFENPVSKMNWAQKNKEEQRETDEASEEGPRKEEKPAKLACRRCGIVNGDSDVQLMEPLEFAMHLQNSHAGVSELPNLEWEGGEDVNHAIQAMVG